MGNCCSNDTTGTQGGTSNEVNMQRDIKNGGGYQVKSQYPGGAQGKTSLGLTQR